MRNPPSSTTDRTPPLSDRAFAHPGKGGPRLLKGGHTFHFLPGDPSAPSFAEPINQSPSLYSWLDEKNRRERSGSGFKRRSKPTTSCPAPGRGEGPVSQGVGHKCASLDSPLVPASVSREVWHAAGDRCQCTHPDCHGGLGRCASLLGSGQGRVCLIDPRAPHAAWNCILLCKKCLKHMGEQGD
jgi:hypothetical protein